MQKTAKIFMNNRSQAVRLPKEFRFSTPEVYIRKQGDEIILSPRPTDWSEYIAAGTITSGPDNFMELIADLPVQEREF
jgi:antitoxin VapB